MKNRKFSTFRLRHHHFQHKTIALGLYITLHYPNAIAHRHIGFNFYTKFFIWSDHIITIFYEPVGISI